MSIELTLSQIRANGFADEAAFRDAVGVYIAEREAHAQTIGEPRPSAHPLVESVVVRYPPPPDLMPDENPTERFVDDFSVVDDAPPPPPPPTLDQRKANLVQSLHQMATQAQEVVWPSLTRRLLSLRDAAARRIDPAQRSQDDLDAIAEMDGIQVKMSAIELHLAQAEVQIYGLTQETIDGWHPVAFPV